MPLAKVFTEAGVDAETALIKSILERHGVSYSMHDVRKPEEAARAERLTKGSDLRVPFVLLGRKTVWLATEMPELERAGSLKLTIAHERQLKHAAAEYSRFARDGGDVPHLPPSHVSRFVSAWRPEPRRALPQHLPRWLALHLGDAGGAPSAAQRDHERAGGTAQNGDANPTAESASGAAAAFSSALQALALEGLTMKPGVHSLHPAVGSAGAHPIGVLGESDMHK